MSTKEKTLPKVSIVSSFSKPHSCRSPYVQLQRIALGHDDSHTSTDISVEDFQDPYEQLPTPGTDRIRAILGLRKGASLPKVNAESMLRYYRYLISRMTLPCEACYSSDAEGTIYPVTVTGLVDPEAMPSDNRVGLCCIAYFKNKLDFLPLVDIEVDDDSPNFQLLEDYWFWLWNWRENSSYRHSNPR